MRLLTLELQAFRSYSELTLDLGRADKASVVGRNGAGKSSLVKAVVWSIWGEGSADDLISRGQDRMLVALTFKLGEDTYRITRTRERGKKSLLALEREDGESWVSLSEAKIADTQTKITALLGSSEVFSASVYSPQNQVGAFLALRPGERKALLGELLDLGRYEIWREDASREARACSEQARVAAASVQALRERLAPLGGKVLKDPAALDELIARGQQDLAGLERDLDAAIERDKAAEQVRVRQGIEREMAQVLSRGREAKERNLQRLRLADQLKSLDGAEERLSGLETIAQEQLSAIARVSAENEAAQRARAERQKRREALQRDIKSWDAKAEEYAAQADAERAKATALRLRDPSAQTMSQPCPTCGRALEDENHRLAVAQTHDAAADHFALLLDQALEKASAAFDQVQQLHGEDEAAVVELPRMDPALEAKLASAREEVTALRRLEGQLQGLGPAEDMAAMKAEYERLKVEASVLPAEAPTGESPASVRQRIAEAQRRVRELEAQLAAHRTAAAEVSDIRADIELHIAAGADAEERQQALEVCARAFGRDGIPAMILDGMVGSIEAAANRALADFGSQMRVTLSTQREKKTGGLAETLDIVVDDGAHEASIDSFSGGEQYRVAVALRLAIAEVLGAGRMECLLIDEITDLDHDGATALIEILTGLDRQVLVVSHDDSEIGQLPQQLLVTRAGLGPSEVVLR